MNNVDEAITILNSLKNNYKKATAQRGFGGLLSIHIDEEEPEAIDIILKEFEEKEKVIDAMANYLYGGTDMSISFNSKEKVRNFFEDKVRGDK
jgi:hypothetical protein